jgi:hypothetical protein
MESPTVPKAETVSKRYSTKWCRVSKGGRRHSPAMRRTDQMIATEKANIMAWYNQAKIEAGKNATDIVNVEAAKNAKILALDNELNAVQIANDAKQVASAKATAEATRAIEEKKALDHVAWMKMEREAYAANDAFTIASAKATTATLKREAAERASIAQAAAQSKTADWTALGGGRSTEAIRAEQKSVEDAYLRQKTAAAGNSRDLIALEEAKNAKMLGLNKEYHASTLATTQREKGNNTIPSGLSLQLDQKSP